MKDPKDSSVDTALQRAWASLEAWNLEAAREDAANILECQASESQKARAHVILARAELATSALPDSVELPERCRSDKSDRVLSAACLRFDAERALAITSLGQVAPKLEEISSEVESLAALCLFTLAAHPSPPKPIAGAFAPELPTSSWLLLLRALDTEARGKGPSSLLNDALEAAKVEGSRAAEWAVYLARAQLSARRRAHREERKARIKMAELLDAWLLELPEEEATSARARPDRVRFAAAELTPVTESAHLVRLAIEMGSEHELSRLVQLALDAALTDTYAERGIWLRRDAEGGHGVAATRQVEPEQLERVQLSSTIALQALERGEIVVSNDVLADAKLSQIESLEFGIKSVLCVPIRARGLVEGAIYLDRRASGRPFDESAVGAAEAVGALLASSLLSARTLTELEARNFALDAARVQLAQALKSRTEEWDRARAKLGEGPTPGTARLVGKSEVMERLKQSILRVAVSDAPVLIHGETGTGKELVARAIHDSSPRRDKPFVAINCAAMSESLVEAELFGAERGAYTHAATSREGLFEAAHGGTLLLDEVGDMSSALQMALLRVLETGEVRRIGATKTRKVDVRILSASHKDLEEQVRLNVFRADLRFRLEVVRLEIPALREHLSDLPELACVLLEEAEQRYHLPKRRLTPSALEALGQRSYPGNVRELRHLLANAALLSLGQDITGAEIPPERSMAPASNLSLLVTAKSNFGQWTRPEQEQAIRKALLDSGGHRSQAAKRLGISRASFYRYLELYGINPKDPGALG